MNYYEILPLKKTGTESQTFTYQSEELIELGTIVGVPLKNRQIRGLVAEMVEKPKYTTRDITKILTSEPVIQKNQITLAQKISDYYYCSLGETINAFLPFELGKKRRIINDQRLVKGKPEKPHILNKDQEVIYDSIERAKLKTTHLIHGVTGSGKTEIYLQLAASALKSGKGSIILVPEISLTPQTLSRFEKRFGDKVAVWHSQLKETEKYQTWEKIRSGEKKIVLGARSAIFMPIKNLGYIVIDEEHENSYKQDQNPKYDAIKVAEWLTELTESKLILGSATPRLRSFHKAQNGEYLYYSLNTRIVQKSMPPVSVVDMRDEFRKGNMSIFSDDLSDAITKTLTEKKQIILFVNRRGASTFIVCRDCGHIEKCPDCEIPLIFHPNEGNQLKCHHCDYKKSVPTVCPACKSHAIKYFGLGTQRVEIDAKKTFPNARIMRMDKDTTQKRGSHEEIYEGFKNNDFDILIGTQIIAKGWDLPNVNLVGVIAADTTLNIPDHQSAEKTFSLLTQVAGRTGRSYHPGEVIIQTYNPDNYAIKYAKNHDYLGFFKEELESRKKYNYPPFSKFIKLVNRNKVEEKAREKANKLADLLNKSLKSDNVDILGPAESFIYRKGGFYHWQIILKVKEGKNKKKNLDQQILDLNQTLKKIVPSDWTIDVDPDNLL
jgi:primosomal protein N' (replication factor Y) (superfamily II helicase)